MNSDRSVVRLNDTLLNTPGDSFVIFPNSNNSCWMK